MKTEYVNGMKITSIYEPDPDAMVSALLYCAQRGALRRIQREQAAQAEVTADKSGAAMPEPVAKG